MQIDLIIVALYLLGTLSLGLYMSRNLKNVEEYAVASRSYPAFVVFATLSASFIGGGFTIGNAEKVFLIGIVNVVAMWGFSLKEFLVAKYIAPHIATFKHAISVGDIMKQAYGKWAKVIAGVMGLCLCTAIVGAQVGAIGYVFEVFLNIPRFWGITLGCSIVIVYVTLGGMKAVVVTDVIQFVILSIGIPLALIFGVYHAGGIEAITQATPAGHFSVPGPMTITAFIGLFFVFLLGEALVPPYLQRLLIGRDVKAVSRGTLWAALFSVPFFLLTGMIGLVALTLNPELNPNLSIPYVVEQALPMGLKGLVIAAMISVVMSTADSYLNSASIAFTHDVIKPLKGRELDAKHELILAKIVTLAVGMFSVFVALSIHSVLDILIYAYQFWAPVMLIPLIAAIYGYQAPLSRFVSAAIAGMTAQIIWNVLLHDPFGIEGLVIGVLVNGLVFGSQMLCPKHNTCLTDEN